MDIFTKASSRGIEIYRLVPNATHLMQPLDKGVFGPLKKEWYSTVRKNTKANPGKPIDKKTFAAKLHETYVAFHKPSIVIGAFKGSGIYPVKRSAISNDRLKPSYTFTEEEHALEKAEPVIQAEEKEESTAANEAFQLYSDTIGTPSRVRYERRLEEGWDVEGLSPGFTVYKKLKQRAQPCTLQGTITKTCTPQESVHSVEHCNEPSSSLTSGLDLLACAAIHANEEKTNLSSDTPSSSTVASSPDKAPSSALSPSLVEVTRLPKVTNTGGKPKPKKLLSSLPYNLTSADAIRQMALQKLNVARKKAEKEKAAKVRYLKKKEKEKKANVSVTPKETQQKQPKSRTSSRISKATKYGKKVHASKETLCPVCFGSFEEENALELGTTWVECDQCQRWMHHDCIPVGYSVELNLESSCSDSFVCHFCADKV
jgi:hypothetical protein